MVHVDWLILVNETKEVLEYTSITLKYYDNIGVFVRWQRL